MSNTPTPSPTAALMAQRLRQLELLAEAQWCLDVDRLLADQTAELVLANRHLGNLLARIHRDGGHRREEVGTDQAVAEADAEIVRLMATVAAAEGLEKALANYAYWASEDEVHCCDGDAGGLWIDGTWETVQELAADAEAALAAYAAAKKASPDT